MLDKITLSHGSGGRLSRDFVEKEILSRFGDGPLQSLPDAAVLPLPKSSIVFSTDSFVVQPLVFPGGNIGDLAVYGTINDIAVSGGRPLWLSLGLILEEGLELSLLRDILDTVKTAADRCGVTVVTGDTKVVRQGQCDGMYINTAGVGELIKGFSLSQSNIKAGDKIIVSGTLGDHGMAVMTAREGLDVKNGPKSDTGPVHILVQLISEFGSEIRIMRDPTRGGAASVLNELIGGTRLDILLDEETLPFSPASRAVSETLGIDLLNVASEGRLIAVCSDAVAQKVLSLWRSREEGAGSVIVGEVKEGNGRVILETLAGGKRLVDVPEGEILPRIC